MLCCFIENISWITLSLFYLNLFVSLFPSAHSGCITMTKLWSSLTTRRPHHWEMDTTGVFLSKLVIYLYNIVSSLFFLFDSLSSFSTFSFYVFVTLDSSISFLGASIVCVSNTIYRGQQIVLWFPDRTSVCNHSWHHSA